MLSESIKQELVSAIPGNLGCAAFVAAIDLFVFNTIGFTGILLINTLHMLYGEFLYKLIRPLNMQYVCAITVKLDDYKPYASIIYKDNTKKCEELVDTAIETKKHGLFTIAYVTLENVITKTYSKFLESEGLYDREKRNIKRVSGGKQFLEVQGSRKRKTLEVKSPKSYVELRANVGSNKKFYSCDMFIVYKRRFGNVSRARHASVKNIIPEFLRNNCVYGTDCNLTFCLLHDYDFILNRLDDSYCPKFVKKYQKFIKSYELKHPEDSLLKFIDSFDISFRTGNYMYTDCEGECNLMHIAISV